MNLLIQFCNLLKLIHASYFLTYAGRKYILVEKQISTSTWLIETALIPYLRQRTCTNSIYNEKIFT